MPNIVEKASSKLIMLIVSPIIFIYCEIVYTNKAVDIVKPASFKLLNYGRESIFSGSQFNNIKS